MFKNIYYPTEQQTHCPEQDSCTRVESIQKILETMSNNSDFKSIYVEQNDEESKFILLDTNESYN